MNPVAQPNINSEADPEMESALIDTLSALPSLERFGTVHHCTTPEYNSKAFWERLPVMPNLRVIAAYLYYVCAGGMCVLTTLASVIGTTPSGTRAKALT